MSRNGFTLIELLVVVTVPSTNQLQTLQQDISFVGRVNGAPTQSRIVDLLITNQLS